MSRRKKRRDAHAQQSAACSEGAAATGPSVQPPAPALPEDDELESQFFSVPPASSRPRSLEPIALENDGALEGASLIGETGRTAFRVASPAAGRFVAWVVAVSATICLAAGVRAAVRNAHHEPSSRHDDVAATAFGASAQLASIATPAIVSTATGESASQDPPNHDPPTQDPSNQDPPNPSNAGADNAVAANAIAPAKPIASADTPAHAVKAPAAHAAPAMHERNAARAGDQKRAAMRALERGDATRSVELAQESVALDPTDAEAWLILGGAYATRGRQEDARRSFASCTKLAVRGPRAECASLLR
jgi:hypothetical protein